MIQLKTIQEKPAFTLTGQELAFIVIQEMIDKGIIQSKETHSVDRVKINGIKGLAQYIGCSIATAQKLKNESKFPFYNIGSKVFFYSDEVSKALKNTNPKSK